MPARNPQSQKNPAQKNQMPRITRSKLLQLAIGIAKYASVAARTEGDETQYLAYQVPTISRLFESRNNALKMPRQTGKTWIASFVAIAYLLCGIDVLVAYPTLQQGWKLLLSKIVNLCYFLGIRLVKCNQYGIQLASGASVHVVTTNDIAKSNRGFSVGCVIIDESQDILATILGKLLPSRNKYKRMDLDTVIVMGTGGKRTHLLESSWRDYGFTLMHIKPDQIISVDPGYAVINEDDKATLSPFAYRTEILCEMISSGNSEIFKNMSTPLPARFSNPLTAYSDSVGIDIGFNPDNTIITWLRAYLGTETRLDVMETLRLDDRYDIQCPKIKSWIYKRGLQKAPIGVEVNGVGKPIYHFLSAVELSDTDPMTRVSPFTATHRNKHGLVMLLQDYDYRKMLHVTDKPMFNALDGLCEGYKEDGKWFADHSDYLSSLIVAAARIGH